MFWDNIEDILYELMVWLEPLFYRFLEIANVTDDNYIFKITSFVSLLIAMVSIFYYMRKTNVIAKKTQDMYEQMQLSALIQKKNGQIHLKKSSITEKMAEKFEYSRIGHYIPFMTSELWTAFICVVAIASFVITLVLLDDMFKAILALGASAGVLIFLEIFLAFKNYQKTDEMLIEFLNMLGNYSFTSNEVTAVFEKISYRLQDPLRSVLFECYLEAQTTGRPLAALHNLSDKIEHPKFKEIIKNLEISIKYSADFSAVVANNRKSVEDYILAKHQRQQIAVSNVIVLCVSIAAFAGMITLMGGVTGNDPWRILLETRIGHIVLIVALSCFAFFYWRIFTINK